MPAPSFRSNSAYQSGTTSVTMAFPAGYQTTDILVLVIETANDWVSPLWATNLTNNGWARVANSNSFPGGTSAAANAVYQDIWWSRPTSQSQTAVILGDAGDHTLAVCAAFANCKLTGSPWDTGTAAGINVQVSTASAQVTSRNITTSAANTLVLTILNRPQDAASGFVNASPLLLVGGSGGDTELTKHCDFGTTSGGGGQIAILSHRKPTAGATANVRANTSTVNTAIIWTGALIGLPDPKPRNQVVMF